MAIVPGPLAPRARAGHQLDEVYDIDRPWVTIVWDDPVNLMSYVTFVFQELFGYSEAKADDAHAQVHQEGKAVVVEAPGRDGARRRRLHAAGLWASSSGLRVKLSSSRVVAARAGSAGERPRPGRGRLLGLLLDQLEQLLARPGPTTPPATRRSPGCSPTPTAATPRADSGLPRAHRSALRRGKGGGLRGRAGAAGGWRCVRFDPSRPPPGSDASNDLRLALGTRLDIAGDTESPDDVADEAGQQLVVYYWVTALQGSLVDALAAGRSGRR